MAFYTQEELRELGLARFGENVLISNKTSIYNPCQISIGNNVRIDDYCVISAGDGGIVIGNYVHIAIFCSLIGNGKITLADFSGLSSRVSIYSSNDDYSGEHLSNPTVPTEFTGVKHADVTISKHTIVGSGSVILPGVFLEEGVAISALSLVTKNCAAFGIYKGNRRIAERNRQLLDLEKSFCDRLST
jgi:acetyltransferase-like isoleucine patch superfamily enzyme